jgi:uncharacterized protein (DUF433 family)/predicted nuclease of predicted toxin-antitoxin system
VLTRTEPIMTQ